MRQITIGLSAFLFVAVNWGGLHAQNVSTSPEHAPAVVAVQNLATVHIHVNTAYDDSESSLTFISHLINSLPPRTEAMLPGEALSSFILRVYDVSTYDRSSPSYLPKTYNLLEQKVLLLNNVSDASKLKAGPVFCPQLPKKALADVNTSLPQNSVPFMRRFALRSRLGNIAGVASPEGAAGEAANGGRPETGGADLSEASVDDVMSVGVNMTTFPKPTGTQTADLDVALTPMLGKELLNDPILSLTSTALSFPLTARLADSSKMSSTADSEDHVVLSLADNQTIRDLLITNSRRDVPLFILDTGWPNATEYVASRNQLRNILSLIWQKKLSLMAMPNVTDPPYKQPPSNLHSTVVQRALTEFENADPNHHVKVVYIPLTQEQGASDLLDLLLETSYLLMYQVEHSGAPIDKTVVRTAKQNADGVVGTLQKTWVGDSVNTDKALLDAVLWVGTAWAELNKTGFVVNESWTVTHEQYFVNYIAPPEGIVIAAAGNLGQNINSALVDFSQRCSTSIDTLAVMNLRPGEGLLCCSSKIDPRNIPDAMAAGFDGEVSGTSCAEACGTSFAAPRVAWIIAAGETLRTGAYDPSRWGIDVKSRLLGARRPDMQGGSDPWLATWLDAARYLSLMQ